MLVSLTLAIACAALSVLAPRTALAQRTGEEWVEEHLRTAERDARSPDGLVPLYRLWGQRDWVDPAWLVDRLRSFGARASLPPERRAMVRYLEALGRRRLGQTAEAQAILHSLGFIDRWLVIGPFDNEGRNGFEREMEPERTREQPADPSQALDGKERPVRWHPMPEVVSRGYVPLDAAIRPAQNACAFAQTTVRAPRAGEAVLWLGAAGQLRAYVNGALVHADAAVRSAWPDRVGIPVRLRQGGNRVLLKVCTDQREMGFFARFTAPSGAPRADLVADPDPANAPVVRLEPAAVLARGTTVLGSFTDLRTRAERTGARPAELEAFARFLSLTGSDNAAAPTAADLAERAAEAEPTWQRWLLVAELAPERNRRLRALDRATALAPADDPRLLVAIGHARRGGAHPDDAIAVLDRAVASDPDYAIARLERALVFDSVGLPVRALRDAEEALLRSPRAAAVIHATAQIAEHAQMFDRAHVLFRELLRVNDADPSLHEAVAREARSRGQREQVRREVERMLSVDPSRLASYPVAAELLEAIGQADGALGVLARAGTIAPDEPALWKSRGELEVRLGRVGDGRASMRRALALSPQDQVLRQHLEALEPSVPRPDEALAEASEVFLPRRVRGSLAAGGYKVRSLADLTVRTVYPNGLSGTFRQSVFQVLTQEGAEAERSFSMQYEPDAQRFELRTAKVYHLDGSVDESASMEEYALTGGASRMYYDARAMVVSFPRLAPGDVVEVRWRVDDVAQRNAFADYFGDLHLLQSEVPRAHVRYVLRAPASRQLYFHLTPLTGLQRSEREEAGTKIYDFAADNVPALPPEDHAPGATERAAYLHVSTYRSWEDVGRWYWGLIADQLQADDRVRSIVRGITRDARTPRDKVRAVYNWVIQNTRYVALEFGIHGFLPYRVPEVCSRGFGDCKDKASTIVSMLREVGIDASIVLVRTRNNGNVHTEPASLAVFDHAIAYIPPMEGIPDGLFLDGTAQSSGMDELPSADQGAMALVVNQRGEARLTRIPVIPADRNASETRSELTVANDGAATLRATVEVRGPAAGPLRSALEAQGTRQERVERWLSPHLPGVRVTEVRVNDMSSVDVPARIEYEATAPSFGVRQGGQLVFPATPPLNLTREYASRSSRTSDVMLVGPMTVQEQRTVRLPSGTSAVTLPPRASIDSPFVQLVFETERQGNVVQIRRTMTYKVQRVPAAQYAAFREVCQRIDDALARRVSATVAP